MLLILLEKSTGHLAGTLVVHGSVGSILGAFSIAITAYVHAWTSTGYAFALMMPGLTLLVPVSVSACLVLICILNL